MGPQSRPEGVSPEGVSSGDSSSGRPPGPVRAAWEAPDAYDTVVRSLDDSGVSTLVRLCVGISILVVAVAATLLLVVEGGPPTNLRRAILIADNIAALVIAVSWLASRQWPSRRTSLIRVMLLAVLFAISLLVIHQPLVGLVGTCCYAALAAYVALFHNTRMLAAVLAFSGVIVAILFVQVIMRGEGLLGAFICCIAVLSIFTVPFGQQIAVHVLSDDVAESDHDPLTRALNRRGLERGFTGLVRKLRGGQVPPHVAVLVLDLDDFKNINDTYGHGVGDEILRDVVRAVRNVVAPKALVARTGGEEFAVVSDVGGHDELHRLGDGVRDAVATSTPNYPVHASVGACIVTAWPVATTVDMLDTALAAADAAMYKAKRAGGNRVEWAVGGLE